jgi:prepilin-type N-terminal cleavage/methylation domain-containing protein
MNLMITSTNCLATRRMRDCRGLTLIEMLVALSVGAMVLAVVAVLSVYALRSFTAMGNYADLEARSRIALDKITREVRQATNVIDFGADATTKWIRLGTVGQGTSIRYVWYADDRELDCEKTGEPTQTYLTECDGWDFALYQRTPLADSTNQFYPTTNASMCKMIEMNWRCSRTLLGRKWSTESIQSARIVLRTNP